MGMFIGGASEWANHEVTEYPEVITRRARGTHKAKTERKPAKPHGEPALVKGSSSDPVLVSTKISSELSDIQVLRAAESVQGGNSVRSVAKGLGVSHTALNKRLKKFAETNGYHPDELDKALIRAVRDAGIPGGLSRLSDIMGWTVVELLEAVR